MTSARRLRCALVLATAVATLLVASAAYAAYFDVTRLTNDGTLQYLPAISGPRIVWHEEVTGGLGSFDFSTDREWAFEDVTISGPMWTRVSGERIVYAKNDEVDDDLEIWTATKWGKTQVTSDAVDQDHPDISGNNIVWSHDGKDIGHYDVTTRRKKWITRDTAEQDFPAVSGSRIVWQDKRNGNWDIYLYDLRYGTTRRITDEAANQTDPAISGTLIVWQDERNGAADIYCYNLATNRESLVAGGPFGQVKPDVSGTRVIWSQSFFGDTDHYLRDLLSSRVYTVATGVSNTYPAAISGNRVVYTDSYPSNDDSADDVYVAELLAPRLTVSGSTKVAYGGRPRLTIKMTTATGTPFLGGITLQRSTDLVHWAKVIETDNWPSGTRVYTAPRIYRRTFYRAVFAGTAMRPPATSNAHKVMPKASVTRPSGPSSIRKGSSFTSRGYLKPRHTAGAYSVKIRCYKKVSGHWVLKKTVSAKNANYSTYTRYSAKFSLPSRGSWRIKARHSDADHRLTDSSYRYIYVY